MDGKTYRYDLDLLKGLAIVAQSSGCTICSKRPPMLNFLDFT